MIMSIYKIYNEAEERFKNVNRKRMPRSSSEENIFSIPSGNAFESLATSNPELFEKKKLKSLLSSKNIVKDFNDYFTKFMDDIRDEYTKEANNGTIKTLDDTLKFNTVALHGYITDIENLKNLVDNNGNRLYNDDEIKRMVNETYIPESLTEEGCRSLIKARLSKNKILTDSLIKMLKANYLQFNLSTEEANSLIDKLNNDSENNKAIGFVKKILDDPSILNKYKIGNNNYDFRPIGGACMFLSNTPGIQITQKPSRKLDLIFKYDAIIVGHGQELESSINNSKEIYDNLNIDDIIKSADRLISIVKNAHKDSTNIIEDANKIKECIIAYKSDNNINRLASDLKDIDNSLISNASKEIVFENFKDLNEFRKSFSSLRNAIHKPEFIIKARNNPEQAIKDGKSQNWTQEPISTLSHSNMTSVIDILRALKSEGFKNIYVGSCNPGGIRIPKDLKDDPDFKVTYGTASVFMESYLSNYTLDELQSELYEIYNEIDNCVITEGRISDFLKSLVKKAIKILYEIWSRVVDFFKFIFDKIREIFSKKLGSVESEKLKKPVKIGVVSFNGDSAKYSEVECSSPEEIKSNISKANDSINQAIRKYKTIENNAIKRIENVINSGKIKNSKEIKQESFNIFSECKFI